MREVGLLDEPNLSEPVPEVNAAESDLVKQAERFLLPFLQMPACPVRPAQLLRILRT